MLAYRMSHTPLLAASCFMSIFSIGRSKNTCWTWLMLWSEKIDHKIFIFMGKNFGMAKVFFRDKWSLPKRMEILGHLADIPKNFNMPIFYCCAERAPYLKDIDPGLPRRKRAELRAKILKRCHTICFLHCLSSADKWVDQFHPDEQVFVVVEHHDNHKNLMLGAAQFFADPRAHSFIANDPNIKWGTLKHMVEEPLFMRKSGISPLQVADTCAFILSRALAGANHIDVFLDKLRPMLSRGFIREFFHDSYREQSS
jgi:hypothetical protein